MADSVKVTPASRKIEFFNPTTASAKGNISLDTSGNLSISADNNVHIGDITADIYVGDGSSNVDIVYTADGEIRTEGSGVELSIVSDENIKFPGSGNVGIGVANPYAKLSVDTNFLVSSSGDTADPKVEGILQRITGTTNDNPSMEIFFVENQGLGYGFRMHFDGTNNRMRFYTHSNSTSGSEVMRFNRDAGSDIWLGLSGNKVMVGSTSAPNALLHVKGDNDGGNFLLLESSESNAALDAPDLVMMRAIGSPGADTQLGTIKWRGKNNAGTPEDITYAEIQAEVESGIDGSENGRLKFGIIDDGTFTQVMTIDGQSNVKIPTDTGKLYLGASDDLSIYHDGSNSYINEGGTGNLRLDGTSLWFNVGGSNIARVESGQIKSWRDVNVNDKIHLDADTGRVGINNTSPAARLDIIEATGAGSTEGDKILLQRYKISGGTGNQIYDSTYHVRNDDGTTVWTGVNWVQGWHIDTASPTVGFQGQSGGGAGLTAFQEVDLQAGTRFFGHGNDYILTIDGTNDRVGIGTTSPLEKIHAAGDIRADGTFLVEDANADYHMIQLTHDNGGTDYDVGIHWQGSPNTLGLHNAYGDVNIRGGASGTLDSSYLTVKGDTGRVGIGTSTPQWDLSVPGDVAIGWYNNFTSTNTGTGATDATLRVAGRAFDKPAIIELANFDANTYYGGTTSFHLGTLAFAMNENSNTVTRVASIDAWTEDPSEAGHFDGRLLFKTSAGDASGANLTTKLVIDGNGFVGIGTDTPDGLLDVSSASTVNVYYTKTATPCTFHTQVQTSAVIMGTTTNHNLQFKANGGVRMTLQPGGNVGINDTTPSYKLDVNGDIRAQDDMYTDKLMASEGIRSSSRAAFNTMTYYYYDRQHVGTNQYFLRAPVGGSSTENPASYFMPHAGQVMQILLGFYGQALATSGTDTWTVYAREPDDTLHSCDFDVNFANLVRIGTQNNYSILCDVSVLDDAISFPVGSTLSIKRTDGSPVDVENVTAQIWVTFDI